MATHGGVNLAVARLRATFLRRATISCSGLIFWVYASPRRYCGASFDHLVGEQLHRVGHFDAQCPGRLQVNDELEFGRLHHRQIGRFLAFENPAV
jgi:hypothetical protein